MKEELLKIIENEKELNVTYHGIKKLLNSSKKKIDEELKHILFELECEGKIYEDDDFVYHKFPKNYKVATILNSGNFFMQKFRQLVCNYSMQIKEVNIMEYNNLIHVNDPMAINMLKENLAHFENNIAYMQAVNDYYKANGTMVNFEGIDYAEAVRLDERVNGYQSAPYPGRFFKENYEKIGRIKSNIDRLENRPKTMFNGWQFVGGEAIINLANNRLQLIFEEKPTSEQRAILKQNGFKFAPKATAWQRPLDYKTMAAANRIDFIKPLDGKTPMDLQPKMTHRNAPER